MAYWYTILGIFLFAIGIPVVSFLSNLIATLSDLITVRLSVRIALANKMIQKISGATEQGDTDLSVIGFEVDSIPEFDIDEEE